MVRAWGTRQEREKAGKGVLKSRSPLWPPRSVPLRVRRLGRHPTPVYRVECCSWAVNPQRGPQEQRYRGPSADDLLGGVSGYGWATNSTWSHDELRRQKSKCNGQSVHAVSTYLSKGELNLEEITNPARSLQPSVLPRPLNSNSSGKKNSPGLSTGQTPS